MPAASAVFRLAKFQALPEDGLDITGIPDMIKNIFIN